MSNHLFAGLAAALLSSTAMAEDVPAFDARLIAHAELPGASFVTPPADAPHMFNMSGRFTSGARVEQPYGIYDERTGLARPFPGQPLQGFSGIRSLGDDRFLVLTDNGFGSKANSGDALLMFHTMQIDWDAGRVLPEETIFLSDPHRIVPFPILNEATDSRYLTGFDFDVESIQEVNGTYWIGDEFGPWLFQTNADGEVLQVFATDPNGELLQGPDNMFVRMPNPGDALPETVVVPRSGGYEGMALGEDGTTLYPLLEQPLRDADGNPEMVNGQPVLRMFEFDTVANAWGDTVRYYPVEDAGHAIGDFNIIDGTRALVIERDWNQGDAREGWAEKPAAFKRVFLIDLNQMDDDGVLRKIAMIDLLNIQDPDGVAPRGTIDGVFTFPFVTIEDVDLVSPGVIVVANDNNFPFSIGREQGRADDNEFILLDVADFLAAE